MTWPYPAPGDDGGARHLVAGGKVPDVALTSTDGGIVKLGDVSGLAIVFVYPWTGRPGLSNPPNWDEIPGAHGSTPEAEGFRDLYSKFIAHGAAIYGVSTQGSDHQREFALRMKLPYPLLSDTALQFADALRLPRFETGGVIYLKRLTIAARAGRIERVFYPIHPPDLHAAEVLHWLRSAGRQGAQRLT